MKLLAKNIRDYREQELKKVDYRCGLCHEPIEDPCCDHSHKTGAIRGIICRRENSALGRIENLGRFGIKDTLTFLKDAVAYLEYHQQDRTNLTHPTFLNEDEKKARAKRRAKKRRITRARSE